MWSMTRTGVAGSRHLYSRLTSFQNTTSRLAGQSGSAGRTDSTDSADCTAHARPRPVAAWDRGQPWRENPLCSLPDSPKRSLCPEYPSIWSTHIYRKLAPLWSTGSYCRVSCIPLVRCRQPAGRGAGEGRHVASGNLLQCTHSVIFWS